MQTEKNHSYKKLNLEDAEWVNKPDKPLYKRLNEERTQGDWMQFANKVVTKPTNYLPTDYDTTIFINNQNLPERKANAEYTALAINNFHKLAEALEEINGMCADAIDGKINIGKIAKISIEALKAIS